jgi:phytoene dehydrogenase-like protein
VAKETVDRFFETVSKMDFFDDQTRTTRDLFEEFFPGKPDVVRLLMEPITYANGSTLDDPAITYGIVFSNFMSKGVFTFEGGTDKFIHMLRDELIRNGVHIRTRTCVDGIDVQDGKISAVRSGDRVFKTRSVISNASLPNTIKKMVDPSHFSEGFMEKACRVRVNTSSCQVYIGIREGEEIDNIGDLFFTSTCPKFDSEAILSMDVTSRTFSFYYPYTRPGLDRYAVVASTNARFDDWAALSEADYSAAKQKLIDETIDSLEKYLPGVREKIDYVEAATPRTFEHYTLHVKGSSFGTKFEGLEVSMGLPDEIGGLFHTGSVAIIMSGWLGAANYGVIVSNKVDKYLEA